MNKTNLLKGYVMVILSAVLSGCMPLITHYIYADGVNRESLVLLRSLLSLPVLALLALRQSGTLRIPAKALPSVAMIGLMGCCITPLLLYGSYQHIATGMASVFHYIYPAVVVLIGLVFLRRKISRGTLCAVILCVVGIFMFYEPGQSLDWTGCALALASGVTCAVYVTLLSVFRFPEVSGFRMSFYVYVVCFSFMLPVCLALDCLTLPSTAAGWLMCVLLALLIGVCATVMFQKGTLLIGGERSAVLSTFEPLTGVVVGILVFDERVTPGMGIGSLLVMAACILIPVFDAKQKGPVA